MRFLAKEVFPQFPFYQPQFRPPDFCTQHFPFSLQIPSTLQFVISPAIFDPPCNCFTHPTIFFQPPASRTFSNLPHPALFSTSRTLHFFNLPHPALFSTSCTPHISHPAPRKLVIPHPANYTHPAIFTHPAHRNLATPMKSSQKENSEILSNATNAPLTLVLLRYFVTRPPWSFYMACLIPHYLLPVYRYGPPLSIDTKMSTTELHMTTLDGAPSQI